MELQIRNVSKAYPNGVQALKAWHVLSPSAAGAEPMTAALLPQGA
jgi:hypothetical protein